MKNIPKFFLLIVVVCALFLLSCNSRSGNPRILVFTRTAGFHHASIPAGAAAIIKLGHENDFAVDTTSDAEMINEDSLQKYAAVVFLSTTDTTDELLNNYQKADFERYIQAGGGFVGIHAATDAEYHWGWYTRLVGAHFNGHPQQQEAVVNVVDADNISTKHLPKQWKRKDEWYNFKQLNKDVHVLLTIDEKTYQGGTNGNFHPMAWYHDYDGGRAWYTELGHTDESFSDPDYLKHILGGIKYAMGDNKKLKYGNVTTQRVPDEDRFVKTQLVQATFFEPTEMTVLPNLDILILQRRGEIMLYKNDTKATKQVGFLNVYWKANVPGVNAEEGMLGLQADPDFKKNHYVYIYYSPADTSVNRLSRFTFENDSVNTASEKVILQLYSQREICCHTGGSIAFGKDRMLYLSTGDNSTPFDEPKQTYVNHGYAPLNDLPGHEQYDARRSASNTNDLRGKILRIKVNEDGSYEIPDGNLYPKGTAKTRPEIYVMGDRNPYRISVDKKNGYLYWGEVGPDASADSFNTRGPRGYDELNQAKKAGYFGWPLFVGGNYPYHEYDYTTGKTGVLMDAAKPMNNSRNNTGLRELPAVSPPFIWYPYSYSKDFPQVGSGGRNAMAGPVYYTDMFPKDTRYPDYYNNKLFIYDWIRGWVKVITMLPNGDFDNMEPFMKSAKFNNMIDMEVGSDGKLYGLEYGSGWFSKNPDAGLFRIDYNSGNRAPKIAGISVDKTSGGLPLKITATVDAKDPEKEKLTYIWSIGNTKQQTTEPKLDYTLTQAGDYPVSVEVKDNENASAKSDNINVYAGNEAPTVNIEIQGNKSFYFPGKQVKYNVLIDDKDDTAKVKDMSSLIVSADYVEGTDKAAMPQGHLVLSEAAAGKNLMLSLDCKSCHKAEEKSVGPAYKAVAERYQKDPNIYTYLSEKIKKGGSGKWGEVAMPAHPNLTENDARQIITWIKSLVANNDQIKSLPPEGTLNPTMNKPVKDNGVLYLSASYSDKGGTNIKSLTGNNTVALRNSKLTFEGVTKMQDFTKAFFNGTAYVIMPKNTGWFSLDNIDLTNITSAVMALGAQQPPLAPCTFELHLDTPDGKKIGESNFEGVAKGLGETPAGRGFVSKMINFSFEAVNDGKLHNLIIVSKVKQGVPSSDTFLSFIQFTSK